MIHIVWNCCVANNVWVATTLQIHKWPRFMDSISQLWDRLKSLEQPDFELAVIIMRHIWIRRSEFVFQNKLMTPNQVFLMAVQIHEFFQSSQVSNRETIPILTRQKVKESPPCYAKSLVSRLIGIL